MRRKAEQPKIEIAIASDPHMATLADALEEKVRRRYRELIFHNREYAYAHNSYEAEQREMRCIQNGDPDGLRQCWDDMARSLNSGGTFFGRLAANETRNVKNLCVSIITLASRAAIEGGLRPEEAFSLCDCYIQAIEECDEPALFGQMALRAERQFTELVHERRQTPFSPKSAVSPHVEQCKNYIFAHLHEKLTVQEIAGALGLHPNYLQSLFKKQEGVSLLQYVLHEKIKLVQNMLVYSEYSYSEIATYLGFSSQSHMGAQFKKFTAMTLHEYRAKFRR